MERITRSSTNMSDERSRRKYSQVDMTGSSRSPAERSHKRKDAVKSFLVKTMSSGTILQKCTYKGWRRPTYATLDQGGPLAFRPYAK